MTEESRVIPMNAAGQQAFEVFYRIAERMYAAAQEAVDGYIEENLPGSTAVADRHIKSRYEGDEFISGRYQRTVQTADGGRKTVTYDYATKEIVAA